MKTAENHVHKELLDSLKKFDPKDKLYSSFLDHFFADYIVEEGKDFELNLLHEISSGLYNLIQKKSKGDFQINILNLAERKESSFVEIINDDMPFLVDSITNHIAGEDVKIKRIINAVIPVNQGINKIKSFGESDKNCHKYKSVISIEIERIDDQHRVDALQKTVSEVLTLVAAAVHDWHEIQSEILKIRAEVSVLEDIEQDYIDFFDWFYDKNFILLGFSEYDISYSNDIVKFQQKSESRRGISKIKRFDDLVSFSTKSVRSFAGKKFSIDFTKSTHKSPVHRDNQIDLVRFSFYDDKGKIIKESRFMGLFTSQVFYQKAQNIPIIREKFNYVIKQSGFCLHSHNGKELVAILESYPREEIFMISAKRLHQIVMGVVSVYGRNIVKVYNRIDRYKRFLSILCFIPKRNFGTGTRQKIQKILAETYKGEITGHQTQIGDMTLARVHFMIKTDVSQYGKVDYDKIEAKILEATTIWRDSLDSALKKRYAVRSEVANLLHKYEDAFTPAYQARFTAVNAVCDIQVMERISPENSQIFDISLAEDNKTLKLKLYGQEPLNLSRIMPVLENFGFDVIDENTYVISPKSAENQKVWLHDFTLYNQIDDQNNLGKIKEIVEPAISDCWQGRIENDELNILIFSSLLEARDISLLRACAKFINQTEFSYSYSFIVKTLIDNNKLTLLLRDYFYAKFSAANGAAESEGIMKNFQKALEKVSNVAEDAVLAKFLEVMDAALRTNFFQKDAAGNYKGYISFKFLSAKISNIPLPKPFVEIFVYSPTMEGVHLRGGKVARGGLRWSDRLEDFRVEVHGLVKAQMTKNSVIVPLGSKGGFVLKKDVRNLNREEFMQEGIGAYKTFLRGLLDITDNIVNDKVVRPQDVVCYDDEDPYLVVAADKGTATFSDIANGISAEYNFWLGDAFASGGSNGYDHKKMGITAKGAWVSVVRHFYEMGVNIDKEEFTAVGIGDMGGDVFGNGMLLSDNMKLVAAFNHMHIFIDPNPDPKISYAERNRLFNLPRSSWKDYNPEKISSGGKVYERSAKTIKLSKAAQKTLGIEQEELSPTELIKKILLSPVDLLWNGGIGTYVKSKSEANVEVGDRANDGVRVDACDLKVRIIGEGGNLGLTQRGRIEYAQHGGRINTDAIDNSAGVDCSDHEVNIKIALENAKVKKVINQETRDELLENMTDEVEELVLHDNALQTQAISLAMYHGVKSLGQQERLISRLESIGYLDRKVEFLPDSEEIARRQAEGKGLTRPELSVLFAYSKNYLYAGLLDSNLFEEKYFESELLGYFPKEMLGKFKKDIYSHKLSKEIVATCITNSMINRVGITYVYRIAEETGMQFCDIARAYTITKDSFALPELWQQIESHQDKVSAELQFEMFSEINVLIKRSTSWLLRNLKHPIANIAEIIKVYTPLLKVIFDNLDNVLSPNALQNYKNKRDYYLEHNVEPELAAKIASMHAMSSACQIVEIARESKINIVDIAKTYFAVGTKLQLNYLRNKALNIVTHVYWDKLAIRSYMDGLFDHQMRITKEVLQVSSKEKGFNSQQAIELWVKKTKKHVNRYNELISDLQSYENPDFAMISVASHRIREVSVDNSL